jgi:hypothetical protein
MLRCIICKFKQTRENVLIKSCYILRKELIKYKCNGVTPMKTHIDYAHPKLFATKKKKLIEMILLYYIQQPQRKGLELSIV